MGGKLNDTGEELNSYSSSWLKSRTPAQLAEIERAARNVLQNIFGAERFHHDVVMCNSSPT